MRVAILTTDNRGQHREFHKDAPWFGMAPEALLEGLAGLAGVEVHVISCIRRPVKSPAKLAENVYFHSLHVPKLGWMSTGYLGCLRAYRRKLTQIQPDLVHGQGTEFGEALCAAYSGFPNVVTLLGIMSEMAKVMQARPGSFYWLATLLETRALRRTMGVLANSRFTEERVRGRARRTWVVPNAVRLAFLEAPLPQVEIKPPRLLNVGLVCPYKRQNELLKVAEELQAEGLCFQLDFIGQASSQSVYARDFQSRVRSSKFARYLGNKSLNELINEYDHSTALVHVSRVESFGLVVAESLARNLKFFGFAAGGVPDIARGVDGAELVPEADWAGLKNALRRWIHSGAPQPVTASQMIRQRYHPEVVARQHLDVYREIVG